MRSRGIGIDPDVDPCWAWAMYRLTRAAKPDLRSSGWMQRGAAGVRLELHVPTELVLLSQYDMWEYVLLGQVIALDHDELHRMESRRLRTSQIERTWDRIFDLTAGSTKLWDPIDSRSIQACLPYIDLGWVKEVRPFIAR